LNKDSSEQVTTTTTRTATPNQTCWYRLATSFASLGYPIVAVIIINIIIFITTATFWNLLATSSASQAYPIVVIIAVIIIKLAPVWNLLATSSASIVFPMECSPQISTPAQVALCSTWSKPCQARTGKVMSLMIRRQPSIGNFHRRP